MRSAACSAANIRKRRGPSTALLSMYMKQQRYAEAESAFLAVYAGYAKSAGGENADTLRVTRSIVEMYVATGQPTKAAEWQAKLPKEPSPKP